MRKEARTIRRDLLGPITRLRFGPEAPVPHFRRKPEQALAATELVTILEAASHRLGMRVPLTWAHEALGIPQAGANEPTVPVGSVKSA